MGIIIWITTIGDFHIHYDIILKVAAVGCKTFLQAFKKNTVANELKFSQLIVASSNKPKACYIWVPYALHDASMYVFVF